MIRLSRRCEYAILLMIELSRQEDPLKFCHLKNIVSGHPVSPKYLDHIAYTLVRGGLLEAMHGLGGGYRLRRDPSGYTILDIVRAVDNESTEAPLEDTMLASFMGVWDNAKAAFSNELSEITLEQIIT